MAKYVRIYCVDVSIDPLKLQEKSERRYLISIRECKRRLNTECRTLNHILTNLYYFHRLPRNIPRD
jgi:hypothetical protein